jgi:GT2 family glycosyltransferase
VTSIVVPIYKNHHLIHDLLVDLAEHESRRIGEIVIVNDNSQDEKVDEELRLWRDGILSVKVMENEKNLGFTLSSNIGLKEAEYEDVFLISSDVRINGKFMEHAVPQMNDKSLVGHKLLSGNTGWNSFDGRVFPYLVGYFLAAKKSVWEQLGYFDENYAPNDFEDVDLSTKAVSLGFQLTPLNNPVIKHLGAQSIGYSPERETVTRKNREYFKEKWIG